ncbi:MAG: plasmid mobilization protein [Faecousia sp.]
MSARNHDLHLRLNDEEYDKLCKLVVKSGLSREAYLRQLIAGLQPRDLPPPDFRPMMRQLYYCGNNLNQIARKAHALNVIDVQKYDDAIQLFRETVTIINKQVLEPISVKYDL